MSASLGFSAAAMGKPPRRVSTRIKSRRRRDNPEPILGDLLFDIFSRLSVKDIANCRCVSKLWSSILRREDFSELFLTISSTRPRLLFALLLKNEWMFYSAPQALDPQLNPSPLVPSHHMCFPIPKGYTTTCSDDICAPVRSLVCSKTRNPMILNPSTGEHLTLPKATENVAWMKSLLGYDPIDKLFKVLCVLHDYSCRVSTLGTRELNWRRIECSMPHKPVQPEILIDGVLYYLAKRDYPSSEEYVLVCFDVRLERFKFIAEGVGFRYEVLINHKGKLGLIWSSTGSLSKRTKRFEVWVLEDVDKVKWSEIFYVLPDNWKDIVDNTSLYFVGMTDAGEIVMSTESKKGPFYIVYFNVVKNTLVRFEIQFKIKGEDAKYIKVCTFIEHVENVGLIDSIL